MTQRWMTLAGAAFFSALLLGGCPKESKVKEPTTKEPVPAKTDPLWQELEALTTQPGAAEAGACEALSFLDGERAHRALAACVKPLVTSAKESPETRRALLELLAQANAKEATELLKSLLGDGKAEVRAKAAEVLLRLGDAAGASALFGYRGGVSGDRSGAYWLVRYQEQVPAEALRAAVAAEDDTSRRAAAILLGVRGGSSALEQVANLAIDPDQGVQTYARYAQARLDSPAALLDELKKELKSGKKTARFNAVEALGYYGGVLGPDARALLTSALNSDADAVVQEQAALSLGLIGGPEAAAALTARLPSASGVLSGKILAVLADMAEPSALEPLLSYAQKADLNSRGQDLARCFVALQDPRAAEYARKLTASPLPHLKRAGSLLLARLGTKEAEAWKPLTEEKDPATRGLALVAGAKGGAPAETFAAFLKDDSVVIGAYARVATMITRSR